MEYCQIYSQTKLDTVRAKLGLNTDNVGIGNLECTAHQCQILGEQKTNKQKTIECKFNTFIRLATS